MNPFKPRDFVFVGIDPKEREVVALREESDSKVGPLTYGLQHGDFGFGLFRTLRRWAWDYNSARVPRMVFSMPLMPGGNRWPRLHLHGPEWLEALTAVRCFVGHTGGTDDNLIRFYAKRRMNKLQVNNNECRVLSSSLTAYRLACAARWQTLKPDDIQNP